MLALTRTENTADNHWLEYRAPRDLFQTLTPSLIAQRDERLISSPSLIWSQWIRSREAEPQILPTLTTLTKEVVAVSGLASAYRMAHFHSASLDLMSGPVEIDQYPPEAFWRENPLTLEQITSRIDSFLDKDQATLTNSLVNEYYPAILLEAALSSTMADFWIQNAERWHEYLQKEPTLWLQNFLALRFPETDEQAAHSR